MNYNRTLLGAALSLMFGLGAVAAKEAPTKSSPTFTLSVAEDKLSAQVTEVPLKTVLDKLAEQVPLKVQFEGGVEKRKISATFKALPLEQGIRRLLEGTSYVLNHSKPGTAAGKAAGDTLEIQVAARDGAVTTAQGADKKKQPKKKPEKSLAELTEQALHAPEEKDRIAGLQALHEQHKEKDTLPIFVTALQDKADQVRRTALNFLSEAAQSEGGEPVPYGPVASLATTQDASPDVRRLALKVATDIDPDASTDLLKQMAGDPDPSIARTARVVLKARTATPPPLPPEFEAKLREQQQQ